MKRSISVAGVVLQVLAASLYAEEGQIPLVSSTPSNNVEPQTSKSAKTPTMCDYVAPAAISVDGIVKGWDFWWDCSFLYWQVRPENFVLCTTNVLPQNPSNNPPSSVTVNYCESPFKPGLKTGVGVVSPYDQWRVGVEYIFLTGSVYQHFRAPPNGLMAPAWTGNTNSAHGVAMDSVWHYTLNLVGLRLSRPSHVGQYCIVTPHIGGRFFSNHQKINAMNVYGLALVDGPPFKLPTYTSSGGWELGPRIGMDGTWRLGYGFEFLGDFSFTMLYAQFVSYHTEIGSVGLNTPGLAVKQRNHYRTFAPNLDVSVGIRWGEYLNSKKQHLGFSAKYELLNFWQNNQLPSQLNSDNLQQESSLVLSGLTLTTQLDF